MILQSGYDCWLTQSADVPMSERVFMNQVVVTSVEQISGWKEIPNSEKEKMIAETSVIDVNNITVESLDKVEGIIASIAKNINNLMMSDEEALSKISFFPSFESFVGQGVAVGFKMEYNGKLYKVIQAHTVQSDWTPDIAVALFKVVQVESEGTEDDAIDWESGMVLEEGKYYMDGGVKYLCIRDSVNPMYYPLADLVSGGYVEVVPDETDNEETKEPSDGFESEQ